jgi:hypothetical protein
MKSIMKKKVRNIKVERLVGEKQTIALGTLARPHTSETQPARSHQDA